MLENNGQIKHLRGWSKIPLITWHGELVQKAGDITAAGLSATDWICYQTHCITLKAIAFHRKSTVFQPPTNLISSTPFPWVPVVRPHGIIQVTETSVDAENKG